jgi:hypothetical protein
LTQKSDLSSEVEVIEIELFPVDNFRLWKSLRVTDCHQQQRNEAPQRVAGGPQRVGRGRAAPTCSSVRFCQHYTALKPSGPEYILSRRERSSKEIRDVMLADTQSSAPLTIPHRDRPDSKLQPRRGCMRAVVYIVCRKLIEAEQDAGTREAVVASLRAKLKQGDKSQVGNSAYRRCHVRFL